MKKLIFLLLIFGVSLAYGQGNQSNFGRVDYVSTVPSGSCPTGIPARIGIVSGTMYTCQNGTWGTVSGSGSIPTGVAKGSQLVSNGVSQPPVYQAKAVIDVRDYGVVGNGIADDTTALQNAVNAACGTANAGKSGTLTFPNNGGNGMLINVSSTITFKGCQGLTVDGGDSVGASAYYTTIQWAGSAGGGPIFEINQTRDSTFKHLIWGASLTSVSNAANIMVDIDELTPVTAITTHLHFEDTYMYDLALNANFIGYRICLTAPGNCEDISFERTAVGCRSPGQPTGLSYSGIAYQISAAGGAQPNYNYFHDSQVTGCSIGWDNQGNNKNTIINGGLTASNYYVLYDEAGVLTSISNIRDEGSAFFAGMLSNAVDLWADHLSLSGLTSGQTSFDMSNASSGAKLTVTNTHWDTMATFTPISPNAGGSSATILASNYYPNSNCALNGSFHGQVQDLYSQPITGGTCTNVFNAALTGITPGVGLNIAGTQSQFNGGAFTLNALLPSTLGASGADVCARFLTQAGTYSGRTVSSENDPFSGSSNQACAGDLQSTSYVNTFIIGGGATGSLTTCQGWHMGDRDWTLGENVGKGGTSASGNTGTNFIAQSTFPTCYTSGGGLTTNGTNTQGASAISLILNVVAPNTLLIGPGDQFMVAGDPTRYFITNCSATCATGSGNWYSLIPNTALSFNISPNLVTSPTNGSAITLVHPVWRFGENVATSPQEMLLKGAFINGDPAGGTTGQAIGIMDGAEGQENSRSEDIYIRNLWIGLAIYGSHRSGTWKNHNIAWTSSTYCSQPGNGSFPTIPVEVAPLNTTIDGITVYASGACVEQGQTATAAESSSTVTLTTVAGNFGTTFVNPNLIYVFGCSVSGYNGYWVVASGGSGTTALTYTDTNTGLGAATGCKVFGGTMPYGIFHFTNNPIATGGVGNGSGTLANFHCELSGSTTAGDCILLDATSGAYTFTNGTLCPTAFKCMNGLHIGPAFVGTVHYQGVTCNTGTTNWVYDEVNGNVLPCSGILTGAGYYDIAKDGTASTNGPCASMTKGWCLSSSGWQYYSAGSAVITLASTGAGTFTGGLSTGASVPAANTITGLTTVDDASNALAETISAAQVLVAGITDGLAPITVTTGTSATLGAGTYQSGYTFNQEGTAGTAVTYTLPATKKGLQYCVRNSIVSGTGAPDTGVLTVYPPSSSYVILNGVRNTIGGGGTHGVASGGAAGDSACFVAVDATDWEVYVIRGTWTAN